MDRREMLIGIFEDTQQWCREDERLAHRIRESIEGTKVYEENCSFSQPSDRPFVETEITVEKARTFETALILQRENPKDRITVHNFASATNPGGGVTKGSTAQEECLCRCSTLYPVLNTEELKKRYYLYHRERHDTRYTDRCIYTPGVVVIKTDTDQPCRMKEEEWCHVDVITCAAPNLRSYPRHSMNPSSGEAAEMTNSELLEMHKKRARHMLYAALENQTDILVLGAFGCGAFRNDPEVVARAYKEILPEFMGKFKKITFAVYCSPKDSRNYDVFRRVLLL